MGKWWHIDWCSWFGHNWSEYAGYEEKFPSTYAVCLYCGYYYKDTDEYKRRIEYYKNLSDRRPPY